MNRANYCVPWSAICAGSPLANGERSLRGATRGRPGDTRAIGGTRRGPTRRERVRLRPPVQSLCPLDAWRTLRDEPWRRYRHHLTTTEERVMLAGGWLSRAERRHGARSAQGDGDTGFLGPVAAELNGGSRSSKSACRQPRRHQASEGRPRARPTPEAIKDASHPLHLLRRCRTRYRMCARRPPQPAREPPHRAEKPSLTPKTHRPKVTRGGRGGQTPRGVATNRAAQLGRATQLRPSRRPPLAAYGVRPRAKVELRAGASCVGGDTARRLRRGFGSGSANPAASLRAVDP
jgi:hypothetical protein